MAEEQLSLDQITDLRVSEVRKIVGGMVTTVKRALPTGSRTDAERFCQISMTALIAQMAEVKDPRDREEKALMFARDNSIRRVIAQAAELDLQPGSALGYCWFIRYGADATFQVGVWGYVQLLLRHPDVAKVHSDVIYQADEYSVVRGSTPELIHKPAWTLEPNVAIDKQGRGVRLGAYATVTFKDGWSDFVVVPEWDIAKARNTSKAPNSPAWTNWPDEMAQRTAIKRGQKKWPKCAEMERALDIDETESLREDLEEANKTVVTAQAAPSVPPQKAALDGLTRELNARQPNAAADLNGAKRETVTTGK